MRRGLTPDHLTRVGAELADEQGLAEVTISAVAREVDVKPASLYAHVRSTDDLRTRIGLLALQEMADAAAHALAGRSGRDALAGLGGAYRDYARAHPGRYAAAQLRLDLETAAASAGPRHAELARAVLRGYGVPEADETHAVRLVGSVFRGFVDTEAGGGFDHSTPSAEASWLRALDALHALLIRWDLP